MAAMAQPAPLDALAHLACPPAPKANRGAAALHAGQLLAYAAGAAVVVVDVSGVECMVATGWVQLCRLLSHTGGRRHAGRCPALQEAAQAAACTQPGTSVTRCPALH